MTRPLLRRYLVIPFDASSFHSITPCDHIHLMIQEFIPPDTLRTAKISLSLDTSSPGKSSPAGASTTLS